MFKLQIDPSYYGVEVPSTLNPGKKAYLQYFVVEKPQNELDEKFIETLYSLDNIGRLTDVYNDLHRYIETKLARFCPISKYLSESSKKYSSLFILSGTDRDNAQLHSMITFYCEKVGNKPTLIIDAFCSNQLLKNKVDNHGGRILFEAINQACKKMKIKQIDLDAVDEAISWYLSKGFIENPNKKYGLTPMKKRISWSSRSPWSSRSMTPKKSNSSPKKATARVVPKAPRKSNKNKKK